MTPLRPSPEPVGAAARGPVARRAPRPTRDGRAEAAAGPATDPSAIDDASVELSVQDRIRLVVNGIPPGRVLTYGQVAEQAGLPRRARLVGRILSSLPADTRIPWHRVVAAGGRIAVRGGGEHEQRRRLRAEAVPMRGIRAATGPRVDLERCGLQSCGWSERHDRADGLDADRTTAPAADRQ